MNINAIRAHLRFLLPVNVKVHLQDTASGPAFGIAVDADWTVWALVPIDDESDERYARFLVSEWHKAKGAVAAKVAAEFRADNDKSL